MDAKDKEKLLARAEKLEAKLLFVKAAEIYLSLSMEQKAAVAFEKGGDYSKAAEIFEKLGFKSDAERCRRLRDSSASATTWYDLQAEFQKDKGNPY